MQQSDAQSSPAEPAQEIVPVHYVRGPDYRTVFAEGCFGGISPRGMIRCSFWNESYPIPNVTQFTVEDGRRGPEQMVATVPGVLRHLEAEVVMDLTAAISFHKWLGRHIETLRQAEVLGEEEFSKKFGE